MYLLILQGNLNDFIVMLDIVFSSWIDILDDVHLQEFIKVIPEKSLQYFSVAALYSCKDHEVRDFLSQIAITMKPVWY